MIELSIDPRAKLPRISKSVRILDMIEARGGMRTKNIQRELWEMTNPDKPFTRALRGYWSTNLFGGMYYGPGLLDFFCKKSGGLWRRTSQPHWGKPWRLIRAGKAVCTNLLCKNLFTPPGERIEDPQKIVSGPTYGVCPACRVRP